MRTVEGSTFNDWYCYSVPLVFKGFCVDIPPDPEYNAKYNVSRYCNCGYMGDM
jgi:hypothetical protein